MTAEAPILVRSFRAGRWTCTWSFRRPVNGEVAWLLCEWGPALPRPGELSKRQIEEYRRKRNAIFAELAEIYVDH